MTALSPPKPPQSKPSDLTPEWRTAAKVFARYILVLFRPWTENGGTLPSPLTWTEFCKFMEDLEFSEDRSGPPTDAEIVRRRWIENASQGLSSTFFHFNIIYLIFCDLHFRFTCFYNRKNGQCFASL